MKTMQELQDGGIAGMAGREGRRAGRAGRPSGARAELKAILEALIFASPEPLTPKAIYKLLDTEPKEDVQAALDELKHDYERPGGLQLVEVAGGYQIVTRPDLHEWVRRLFHERTTQKLTVQALETLGRHRLQAADHRARDHRDPRRQHVRRAQHAARAAPDQDRRPQAGGRPAVPVRDDEGVSDPLRPERSQPICRRSRTWPRRSASSAPLLVERTPSEEQLPLDEPDPDEPDVRRADRIGALSRASRR